LNTKQQVGYLMSINNVNTTFYLIWQIKYLVAKLCIEHMPSCFWYNILFIKNTVTVP
jgi:hypothetical protein